MKQYLRFSRFLLPTCCIIFLMQLLAPTAYGHYPGAKLANCATMDSNGMWISNYDLTDPELNNPDGIYSSHFLYGRYKDNYSYKCFGNCNPQSTWENDLLVHNTAYDAAGVAQDFLPGDIDYERAPAYTKSCLIFDGNGNVYRDIRVGHDAADPDQSEFIIPIIFDAKQPRTDTALDLDGDGLGDYTIDRSGNETVTIIEPLPYTVGAGNDSDFNTVFYEFYKQVRIAEGKIAEENYRDVIYNNTKYRRIELEVGQTVPMLRGADGIPNTADDVQSFYFPTGTRFLAEPTGGGNRSACVSAYYYDMENGNEEPFVVEGHFPQMVNQVLGVFESPDGRGYDSNLDFDRLCLQNSVAVPIPETPPSITFDPDGAGGDVGIIAPVCYDPSFSESQIDRPILGFVIQCIEETMLNIFYRSDAADSSTLDDSILMDDITSEDTIFEDLQDRLRELVTAFMALFVVMYGYKFIVGSSKTLPNANNRGDTVVIMIKVAAVLYFATAAGISHWFIGFWRSGQEVASVVLDSAQNIEYREDGATSANSIELMKDNLRNEINEHITDIVQSAETINSLVANENELINLYTEYIDIVAEFETAKESLRPYCQTLAYPGFAEPLPATPGDYQEFFGAFCSETNLNPRYSLPYADGDYPPTPSVQVLPLTEGSLTVSANSGASFTNATFNGTFNHRGSYRVDGTIHVCDEINQCTPLSKGDALLGSMSGTAFPAAPPSFLPPAVISNPFLSYSIDPTIDPDSSDEPATHHLNNFGQYTIFHNQGAITNMMVNGVPGIPEILDTNIVQYYLGPIAHVPIQIGENYYPATDPSLCRSEMDPAYDETQLRCVELEAEDSVTKSYIKWLLSKAYLYNNENTISYNGYFDKLAEVEAAIYAIELDVAQTWYDGQPTTPIADERFHNIWQVDVVGGMTQIPKMPNAFPSLDWTLWDPSATIITDTPARAYDPHWACREIEVDLVGGGAGAGYNSTWNIAAGKGFASCEAGKAASDTFSLFTAATDVPSTVGYRVGAGGLPFKEGSSDIHDNDNIRLRPMGGGDSYFYGDYALSNDHRQSNSLKADGGRSQFSGNERCSLKPPPAADMWYDGNAVNSSFDPIDQFTCNGFLKNWTADYINEGFGSWICNLNKLSNLDPEKAGSSGGGHYFPAGSPRGGYVTSGYPGSITIECADPIDLGVFADLSQTLVQSPSLPVTTPIDPSNSSSATFPSADYQRIYHAAISVDPTVEANNLTMDHKQRFISLINARFDLAAEYYKACNDGSISEGIVPDHGVLVELFVKLDSDGNEIARMDFSSQDANRDGVVDADDDLDGNGIADRIFDTSDCGSGTTNTNPLTEFEANYQEAYEVYYQRYYNILQAYCPNPADIAAVGAPYTTVTLTPDITIPLDEVDMRCAGAGFIGDKYNEIDALFPLSGFPPPLNQLSIWQQIEGAQQNLDDAKRNALITTAPPSGELTDKNYCNFGSFDYTDGFEYLRLWDVIDCKLKTYLGMGIENTPVARRTADGGTGSPGIDPSDAPSASLPKPINAPKIPKILLLGVAAMFTDGLGVAALLLSVIVTVMVIQLFIRIAQIYIMAFFSVTLLIFVSPLVFPTMLFERTKHIFNGWVTQVFANILQPVILVAFLSLLFVFTDQVMFGSTTVDQLTGDNIVSQSTCLDPASVVAPASVDPESLTCLYQLGYIYNKEVFDIKILSLSLPKVMWLGDFVDSSVFLKALLMMMLIMFVVSMIITTAEELSARLAGNIGGGGAGAAGLAGTKVSSPFEVATQTLRKVRQTNLGLKVAGGVARDGFTTQETRKKAINSLRTENDAFVGSDKKKPKKGFRENIIDENVEEPQTPDFDTDGDSNEYKAKTHKGFDYGLGKDK